MHSQWAHNVKSSLKQGCYNVVFQYRVSTSMKITFSQKIANFYQCLHFIGSRISYKYIEDIIELERDLKITWKLKSTSNNKKEAIVLKNWKTQSLTSIYFLLSKQCVIQALWDTVLRYLPNWKYSINFPIWSKKKLALKESSHL